MPDNTVYLTGRKAQTLYTEPDKFGKGAYATLVGDSEEVIGEIDVTTRSKLAISAFYVNDRADFSSLKITKLKYHNRYGWQIDGEVNLNHSNRANAGIHFDNFEPRFTRNEEDTDCAGKYPL